MVQRGHVYLRRPVGVDGLHEVDLHGRRAPAQHQNVFVHVLILWRIEIGEERRGDNLSVRV